MTPSKEQFIEWIRQASKEPGFDPVDDFEAQLASLDDNDLFLARIICDLAYAAGRRAGMEEAAKICEGEISGAAEDASRDAALSHCIRQIRAAMEADHG